MEIQKIQKGALILFKWPKGRKKGLALVKKIYYSRKEWYVRLKIANNSTVRIEYRNLMSNCLLLVQNRGAKTVRQAVERHFATIVYRLAGEVCALFKNLNLQTQQHEKERRRLRKALKKFLV